MFFSMKDVFADISYGSAYFGLGTGSIHVNHLQCNSREHRLLDCGYDNVTESHHEDWGVSCKNGNKLSYYLPTSFQKCTIIILLSVCKYAVLY